MGGYTRKRCKIGRKLVVITNWKSICTKIGDLEWPWTAQWPFCAISPNSCTISSYNNSSARVRLPCNFFTTALPAAATLQLIELTSADVCALITLLFTFTLRTLGMPLVDSCLAYTILRCSRHCLVPYRCPVSISWTHVASSTSFISVAITHTASVSRLIVGRIAVLHTPVGLRTPYMWPIVTNYSSVVCRSACHSSCAKNGWTYRDAVWVLDSGGSKKACVTWGHIGATWRIRLNHPLWRRCGLM